MATDRTSDDALKQAETPGQDSRGKANPHPLLELTKRVQRAVKERQSNAEIADAAGLPGSENGTGEEGEADPSPGSAPSSQRRNKKEQPWALAKRAPSFLAEQDVELDGLAKAILFLGAITLMVAPKGVGKTQVALALAVILATGGEFRNQQVQPVRVLLVDRENPVAALRKRLRAWGAAEAANLDVLTRQDAPDLKDKGAWASFPVEKYDVVIIDSIGASTEGVTEREGRQTTEILATILDLAHRGVAILLLQNTEKTGTNIRGRGEWADRADIQYEVRDATSFTPSGKRPWWLELPKDGAADWAERAARRKGRTVYRLAFIPAKFRLAVEPDPFCLELSLPEGEAWTLRDITADLIQAGEAAQIQSVEQKLDKQARAAGSLATIVRNRAAAGNPILKTKAEAYLHEKGQLARDGARAVISDHAGKLWQVREIEGRKGRPRALFPLDPPTSQPVPPPKSNAPETPHKIRASETGISAAPDSSARENTHPEKSASNGLFGDPLFSRAGKSTPAEMDAQKSPENQPCESALILAADEVQEPFGDDKEVIE